MNYYIKSGVLYASDDNTVKARIKSAFSTLSSMITLPGSNDTYKTTVSSRNPESEDVRNLTYLMTDALEQPLMVAAPDYAPDSLPLSSPAPLHRIPRVDHAAVSMNGEKYALTMQDSAHYTFKNARDKALMTLSHRGMSGGWNISADSSLSPAVLCGLYNFCRYIEQENEFFVV